MIRYKKLGYVALNVTDVEKSHKFYEELVGLQSVNRVENGPAFLRCSSDHHNLVLYPAQEAGLKRIGLEVEDSDQLDIAFEHFTKLGLNPEEVGSDELRELAQGRSIRIEDPVMGITFEFYSDITQMGKAYNHSVAKIARLGHVVLSVTQFDEMVTFMKETLNFKVSDYMANTLAFMRCFPNPYHHSFALAKSNENKFHHVNFMVSDIDDIGIARNRMIDNDIPIVFGPGRHAPSDSIFLYFLDPDGMTAEYSFGMEEFSEEGARKPRMLDASLDILDTWGGRPDPRMASKGKIGLNS